MSGAKWQMWPALGIIIALWVGVTMLIAACAGGQVVEYKPTGGYCDVLLNQAVEDKRELEEENRALKAQVRGQPVVPTWSCQCVDGWHYAPVGKPIQCCGDRLRGE